MSEKDITAGYDSEASVDFQPKHFVKQIALCITKINFAELRILFSYFYIG